MTSLALTLAVACFVLAALAPMIRAHLRLSTNDASQTVKPGSVRKSAGCDPTASVAEVPESNRVCQGYEPQRDNRPPTSTCILAIALLFASTIPCQGQEHGGFLDNIGERAIKKLDENTKQQGRIADFFERISNRENTGLLDRFDGKRISGFFDRIGTLVWLTFIVAIIALGSWGLRELASVVKATGDALKAFRREESE